MAGKSRTLWIAACSCGFGSALDDSVCNTATDDVDVADDDADDETEVLPELQTRSKNAAAGDVAMHARLRTSACTNTSSWARRPSATSLRSSASRPTLTRLGGSGGSAAASAATGAG